MEFTKMPQEGIAHVPENTGNARSLPGPHDGLRLHDEDSESLESQKPALPDCLYDSSKKTQCSILLWALLCSEMVALVAMIVCCFLIDVGKFYPGRLFTLGAAVILSFFIGIIILVVNLLLIGSMLKNQEEVKKYLCVKIIVGVMEIFTSVAAFFVWYSLKYDTNALQFIETVGTYLFMVVYISFCFGICVACRRVCDACRLVCNVCPCDFGSSSISSADQGPDQWEFDGLVYSDGRQANGSRYRNIRTGAIQYR